MAGFPKPLGRLRAVSAIGLVLCAGWILPLAASASSLQDEAAAVARAQAPDIELRYTRVYGSDTLEIARPLLSPDGQWIVFADLLNAETSHLWIVPSGGGLARQLTFGPHGDYPAGWFPQSDRIAFNSDRLSGDQDRGFTYLMTLPFNSATGRADGPIQPATVEPAWNSVISPDGEWIAYATPGLPQYLRVIPKTGGSVRTLVEAAGNLRIGAWSSDGDAIFYAIEGTDSVHEVARVRSDGGPPRNMGTVRGKMRTMTSDGDFVLLEAGASTDRQPIYEFVSPANGVIGRLLLHRNMRPVGFTPDGTGFIAVVNDIVAPLRVLPVDGGPDRQLNEARAYDTPLGWSGDGARVFFKTDVNGQDAVLVAPIDGSAAKEISIPADAADEPIIFSPDGRYMAYALDTPPGSGSTSLIVRNVDAGTSRVLSRTFTPGRMVLGRGGLHQAATLQSSVAVDGEEFIYLETRGDSLLLRASPPEGPSRLLRSFALSDPEDSPRSFAVIGNRLAFARQMGDSVRVYLAESPAAQARPLTTVRGEVAEMSWSPDGRSLALNHYLELDRGLQNRILILRITPSGTLASEPRYLETGAWIAWGVQWLPDNRRLTVFGMNGPGSSTDIWLVSLAEGESPVALTQDDPAPVWDYALSPDGRFIAYASEIQRGSSIWRVDFGDLLTKDGSDME